MVLPDETRTGVVPSDVIISVLPVVLKGAAVVCETMDGVDFMLDLSVVVFKDVASLVVFRDIGISVELNVDLGTLVEVLLTPLVLSGGVVAVMGTVVAVAPKRPITINNTFYSKQQQHIIFLIYFNFTAFSLHV